jgi:hypothetical protein
MSFLQYPHKLKEELRAMILKVQPLACIRESLTRASSYEEI